MKQQSEKMVAGGFILALLVLSGVAIGSYLSVQKLIASRQSVERTFEVLDALDRVFTSSTTIASGRYGYVISRKKTYLDDYQTGLQGTKQAIADVRHLTSDNPEQQRQLAKLEQLVTKRIDLAQRSIALLQQGRSDDATQAALSNQGLLLGQQVRLTLATMKQEERRLLEQRKAATDDSVRQAIFVNGVGYLLGFNLLMGVFLMLHRQIRIRQKAEAALQKHSEEVHDLYNRAPCGYHSLDAAGRFIRINDTELDWLGHTREAVLHKKHFVDVITAEGVAVFQQHFAQFKAQGWISDVEFELIRNDGTLLPVSLSATVINDAEGNFLMSRSTLFDISDRKRAQAALQQANEQLEARVQERTAALSDVNALLHTELIERRLAEQALFKSEKQLRTITNALPVLISYVDADRCYRFNNQAYEQWFGYDWTGLEGQHLSQVLGESAYQSIEPYVTQVMSGQTVTYESLIPYKDGGVRWVNAVYLPDMSEQGEVRGYFALVADINERKLAEEALRESKERLTFTLQTAEMGDWDLNLSDRTATRSLRHDQIFGYDCLQSEWSYEKLLDHVLPDDRAAVDTKFSEALAHASLWDFECRIRRVDGALRWIWARGHLYQNAAGDNVRMLGLVADITDRKHAEHALQQVNDALELKVQERTASLKQLNANLVRSNQELEQFAYVASHDLQEPLRAVMGYTQLLMQDYQAHFDANAHQYADYIVDGARRMQQLIQDLLHYSRVGTRDLVVAPTDCNVVLKKVLGNLQVAIGERHAVVTADPLPSIPADTLQLTQLFQNLIGNAIKFCRDAVPTVHISARRIEQGRLGEQGKLGEQREQCNTQNSELSSLIPHPSSLIPHPLWLFSVRDNGIGIKPRYLERIFEIFKRLHTRTEFSGTGIGLAVCKKIVDRHGGRIWAESQLGAGTTFYFTIPDHDHANVEHDRDFTG